MTHGLQFAHTHKTFYLEMFSFANKWEGVMMHNPKLDETELTLWNSACILHERTIEQKTQLELKVLECMHDGVLIDVDDISDGTLQLWMSKTNANIYFATGLRVVVW